VCELRKMKNLLKR